MLEWASLNLKDKIAKLGLTEQSRCSKVITSNFHQLAWFASQYHMLIKYIHLNAPFIFPAVGCSPSFSCNWLDGNDGATPSNCFYKSGSTLKLKNCPVTGRAPCRWLQSIVKLWHSTAADFLQYALERCRSYNIIETRSHAAVARGRAESHANKVDGIMLKWLLRRRNFCFDLCEGMLFSSDEMETASERASWLVYFWHIWPLRFAQCAFLDAKVNRISVWNAESAVEQDAGAAPFADANALSWEWVWCGRVCGGLRSRENGAMTSWPVNCLRLLDVASIWVIHEVKWRFCFVPAFYIMQ